MPAHPPSPADAGPLFSLPVPAPSPSPSPSHKPARSPHAVPMRGRETLSTASRLGEVSRAATVLLLTITAAFVALGVWAALAKIDTVAQTLGKVVPSARVQVVQSLEGGVVQEIHVQPGEVVEAGALLVSLSPVQVDADLRSRSAQSDNQLARSARLQAEAGGGTPVFDAALRQRQPQLVAAERAAWESRASEQATQLRMLDAQVAQKTAERVEVQNSLETAQRSLKTTREERVLVENLVQQGLEPRIELVRLERQIAEAEGRREGAIATLARIEQSLLETQARRENLQRQFRAQARDELNRVQAELRALGPTLPALQDRIERTALKAPVRSVVNRVFVSNVGAVARAGEPVVELVPVEDRLVVEAMVLPKDIGFIRTGQDARVKLTAYDYAIYGSLPARVTRVGADAVTNERGDSHYIVHLETDRPAIESLGRELKMLSGMQAQSDIVTGSRTVAEYLLKPLLGVRENAFRER
ncbi:HlyD family type I secretion periplasmic adaptor subunit [Leptothrix discophora]|uniref:Membrane fusion protein (MFP) family protein n=1 Tax=Leptothrix discophora TaxID=89 RepID=A0ABT9G440_LEPDI|nr:HlyD family type I secretion periplasmic adaptor subunit [Leptothrix discophora]MDP4301251.1 HlyD family type I secretion periplasmic adaptor subunit [Leptothrix discophora]